MPYTYTPTESPNVICVNEVVEKNNIRVIVDHQENKNIVACTDRNKRQILINNNCFYVRQYEDYVIAHMLGHLAKHDHDYRDNIECFDQIKTYWNKKECEAHAFALNLLMPIREVIRYGEIIIDEYNERFKSKMTKDIFLDVMATSFKVPKEWIQMRLRRYRSFREN